MKLALLFLLMLGCAHAPAPRRPSDLDAGDHTTQIDGLPLAYHVAGSGPRCLVIPGGPGLEWRYLRMPQLERRLTLIYVEPIGSGASGRLPAGQIYSLARYATQIDQLRAKLGLGRACIIGHSHGAFVAEQLAVTHPDHISIMVVYGGLTHQGGEWIEEMIANMKWFEKATWYAEASKALLEEEAKTDTEATATWHKVLPFYFADYDGHREAYDAAAKVAVSAAPSVQRDS